MKIERERERGTHREGGGGEREKKGVKYGYDMKRKRCFS